MDKHSLMDLIFSSSALPKMNKSSANWRGDIGWQPLASLIHFSFLLSSAFCKSLDSTSAAMINKNGERGSPYLRPLCDWKNPYGEPFMSIEKEVVEMHSEIQFIHLSSNPKFLKTLRIKGHSSLS